MCSTKIDINVLWQTLFDQKHLIALEQSLFDQNRPELIMTKIVRQKHLIALGQSLFDQNRP
jgi:hypothetical protein